MYRNNYLVNWCPTLRSTISDIEVEYLEVTKKTDIQIPGYNRKISFGEIAEVAFKVKDSNDEIIVATTRVESMPGDVAIAVNGDDSRYTRYIGQQAWHPIREIFIPIIEDSSVKPDYGTGALKITPAHDHLDHDIAQKNNLKIIQVIGEDGKMNENAKDFSGLLRFTARHKILDKLANCGALRAIKDHPMSIPVCSRSGDVIEYLLKEQWFVRTKELAARAAEAVKMKKMTIDPNIYEEIWFNRLDNMKDWCVSRQLWWGHRIPAYKCVNESESHWIAARNLDEAKKLVEKKYNKNYHHITQDNDVLDTWFSAALLPLTALGWPDKNYTQNYPLNLMETGNDILLYWVARMTMLCDELVGNIPFEQVLLHGVLCDDQGKKMSKSLGNVILPEYVIDGISKNELDAKAHESNKAGVINKLELKRTLAVNNKIFLQGIENCGVDALRFTLCAHNIKNEKISFNITECKTNKYFCNKILQASKYILLVTDNTTVEKPEKLLSIDQWILSRMAMMVDNVNQAFEQKNFYKAIIAIKQFFYYEFCDIYLEATKPGLQSGFDNIINSHRYTLIKCLEVSLRIMAPIMPYFSEELYSRLAKKLPTFATVTSIMEIPYPTSMEFNDRDEKLEKKFQTILKIISSIRNILTDTHKTSINAVHIVLDSAENYDLYNDNINLITATTRISNIKIFLASDYNVDNDSIYSCELESRLYYLLDSKEVVKEVKDRVEKKKQKIQEKLEKLLKIANLPKYTEPLIDEDKMKIKEKVTNYSY